MGEKTEQKHLNLVYEGDCYRFLEEEEYCEIIEKKWD